MKQQQLYDLQQQNAAAAQGRQVLQTWQKRPPLAPNQNPLLGRWNSQGTAPPSKAAGGDMAALAAALIGGVTGGMCESMLGHGIVEFRPTAVVAIGPGGREQLMYHAEYRGGGSRVVVLPKDAASFTHMIIDFSKPDRAQVAAVGCSRGRHCVSAFTQIRRERASATPPRRVPAKADSLTDEAVATAFQLDRPTFEAFNKPHYSLRGFYGTSNQNHLRRHRVRVLVFGEEADGCDRARGANRS